MGGGLPAYRRKVKRRPVHLAATPLVANSPRLFNAGERR
jgi:hypothetical protein